MTLFRRVSAPEARAIDPQAWIRGLDYGSATKAGVSVTADSALRLGAMWSSANLLASVVSNLPVDVFRGSGASKTPVSPQPRLVASPSLVVEADEWVYQAMMSLLLRGNAYGVVVERDSNQRPTAVEWLNPDVVTVKQKSSLHRPTYKVGGVDRNREDILHMRAFLTPGSAVGLSPVTYHAEMLGVGLAAQQYGAQWFGQGGHPTALFQNTRATIDPDKAATIKERISAVLRGGREPLVLGSDWDYKPLQVSAGESAFIESMGYTDAQVARLYGPGLAEVLGYGNAGSTLTYSNRVDRSLDLLTYTVMPWVQKFERMWTRNIAQPQTARINTNAFLRADNKSRHETYRIDREIGLYNIDELRALEDQPPLPDGQGQDYTPLRAAPTPPQEESTDGNQ